MNEPTEADTSLLVVILDINAEAWGHCPLKFESAVQQVMIFINAYLALKPENQLAVLAVNNKECTYLFPTDNKPGAHEPDVKVYEQFRVVDAKMLMNIQEMLKATDSNTRNGTNGRNRDNMEVDVEAANRNSSRNSKQIAISKALSKALCYINRETKDTNSSTRIWPRILVISASDDSPHEYISLMNSIFAAQKMNVLIDTCKVQGQDSVFLQQAAEITGGNYLNITSQQQQQQRSLLQSLLLVCLPDHYTREVLYSPHNNMIDFRAACFCHKRIVSIGYVCSVCLSIFCKISDTCSTCNTKFSIKQTQIHNGESRPALVNGSN